MAKIVNWILNEMLGRKNDLQITNRSNLELNSNSPRIFTIWLKKMILLLFGNIAPLTGSIVVSKISSTKEFT